MAWHVVRIAAFALLQHIITGASSCIQPLATLPPPPPSLSEFLSLDVSVLTSRWDACQVRTYSKVFWKRYKELGEDQGEKYIKQIERGEQRIQRQQDIMDAIAAKMDRYRNPWQVKEKMDQVLRLVTTTGKAKMVEIRFLVAVLTATGSINGNHCYLQK